MAEASDGRTGAGGYIVGVDIGGTFTDCTVIAPDGTIRVGKVVTRPDDRARSFFEAIEEAAGAAALTLAELLERTERLVHGTTTGTNALITRGGACVGLLTTVGHRDMTTIMKGSGRLAGLPPEQLFNLAASGKPAPLVPKRLIAEVHERIDFEGEVIVPLDEDSVRAAAAQLIEEGVEAVAISLLWSMRNDAHERRVEELVRALDPTLFVTRASALSARLGEYERTMTCVLNAYIGPLMTRYIDAIESGARRHGYSGRILYAQCAGGAITAEEAQRSPVLTMHSGPVGGTLGSAFLGTRMQEPDLLVTDMGGTSFDVSIVRGASPEVREVSMLERFEIALPMVYLDTVGAGGGSIAWVDEAGGLQVGPQSAGSDPGPACYGRGGTEATVTDADVVLGIIDPHNFLHGAMDLDAAAAAHAVGQIADRLGLGLYEAAAGISRVVDSKMADLLRRMSVLRGFDPREFACFAYGGGGPVHAGAVGREVGVKRVIVPLLHVAPVWSAFGAAIAEVTHVHQRWVNVAMPADPELVNETFDELEEEARAALTAEGFPDERIDLARTVRMKYRAQVFDVEVPLRGGPLTVADIARLEDDFGRIYDTLHGEGSGYREGGSEATAFIVRARGVEDPPPLATDALHSDAVRSSRTVYWDELGQVADTPVLTIRSGTVPGELEGPLLVELPDTVAVLRPGQRGRMDPSGSLVIEL